MISGSSDDAIAVPILTFWIVLSNCSKNTLIDELLYGCALRLVSTSSPQSQLKSASNSDHLRTSA